MPSIQYNGPDLAQRFFGPRAKLTRAAHLIQELRREHANSTIEGHYTVQPVFREEDYDLIIDWNFDLQWPGAIAGDCIHNLRCALDLMASELARLQNRSDRDVYFPFAATEGKLDDAIKSKCFSKAGEDAVDLLRHFAPYKGGNDPLRAIHDMDISDKHTALMVVIGETRIDFTGAFDLDAPDETSNFKITSVTSVWKFPDDCPLAGMPVIPTLEELHHLVTGIVEAFDAMVDARGA